MGIPCYLLARRYDETHIGVLGFTQRGRHAYANNIKLGYDRKVCSGAEFLTPHQLPDFASRNVLDVRLSRVNRVDFLLLDIDPDDRESRFRKFNRQRAAHVAEADDSYTSGPLADLGTQGL